MRDQRRSAVPPARHLGVDALHPRRSGAPAALQRRPGYSFSVAADRRRRRRHRELSPDTSEQTVNGAYAWVITDSGIVYLVNINPVLRGYSAVVRSCAAAAADRRTRSSPRPRARRDRVGAVREHAARSQRDQLLADARSELGAAARRRLAERSGDRPVHRALLDAGVDPQRHGGQHLLPADRGVLPAGIAQSVKLPGPDRSARDHGADLDGRLGGRPVRRPQQRPSAGQ